MSPKRTDYISWDRYFMGVALLSAERSKDPNTQVGACIVNRKNRIVGIGYNGFPHGVSDDEFPWEASDVFVESKYPYVVHAEPNAILNANAPVEDCVIYVTLFPCHECVKLIIQSGIRKSCTYPTSTIIPNPTSPPSGCLTRQASSTGKYRHFKSK